jgi:hypothetical protein
MVNQQLQHITYWRPWHEGNREFGLEECPKESIHNIPVLAGCICSQFKKTEQDLVWSSKFSKQFLLILLV